MYRDTDQSFSFDKKTDYTDYFDSIVPHAVHLKDAQTKKYILCNHCCAELIGVKSASDLVGLTSDYFTEDGGVWWKWNFSTSFKNWINKQKKLTEELEKRVQITKNPVIGRKSLHFTPSGFILIEKLFKQPILSNCGNKITAILNTRLDLTSKYNLFELLDLYLKFYTEKQAIQKLLQYFKIDNYFIKLPTLHEIHFLLALHQKKNISILAGDLNFSIDKIDYYVDRLQRKLISQNLNNVLEYLSKSQ